MADRWVVNASPLIVLAKIGQSELLPRLAGELVIPAGVALEVNGGPPDDAARAWLQKSGTSCIHSLPSISPELAAWDLGLGETEVLQWAMTHEGFEAILDDHAARECARALGLPVRGTLGVILAAKQRGFITRVRPLFEELLRIHFHIAPLLLQRALDLSGES